MDNEFKDRHEAPAEIVYRSFIGKPEPKKPEPTPKEYCPTEFY
jgi:hypothetical protein